MANLSKLLRKLNITPKDVENFIGNMGADGGGNGGNGGGGETIPTLGGLDEDTSRGVGVQPTPTPAPAPTIQSQSQPQPQQPVNYGFGRVFDTDDQPRAESLPQTQTMMTPQPSEGVTPVTPVTPENKLFRGGVNPNYSSKDTQSKINEIYQKDYSKAKFDPETGETKPAGKDRDKKWSLGEKIAGAFIGAAQGFANGGGLVGALAGGIGGGTDRNFMEKQDDRQKLMRYSAELQQQQKAEGFQVDKDYKEARAKDMTEDNRRQVQQFNEREQNKFKLDQQRHKERLELLQKQLEGKFKPYTDENGKVWLRNETTGEQKPVMDPDDPTKQDIDPNFKTYETYSPITGQKVTVKGSQLYSNESNIAAGNAQRTQSAQTTNVNNEQEWENAKKKVDDDRVRLTNEANAEFTDAFKLDEEANMLENQANSTDDEATKRVYTTQVAEKREKANKLRASSNSKSNQAKNLQYPAKPSQVQPQTVKVPTSKDPMGLYR